MGGFSRVLQQFSILGEQSVRCPSSLEEEIIGLFEELRNPLIRYLLSHSVTVHDAEEIVQEAFLALFHHMREGKSRANLKGWLFRVVHNMALKNRMRLKLETTRFSSDPALFEHAVNTEPGPEECFTTVERRNRLQAVVCALSTQDRSCLSLRAEGLRYREIADILGVALGSVAVSLSRSLSRLKCVADR